MYCIGKYLFGGFRFGSMWKSLFSAISWESLRLNKSLPASMTSSRFKTLGGLAVRGKHRTNIWLSKLPDNNCIRYRDENSQDGVQCLLEQSLLKLSREESRSLAAAMPALHSDNDSASLPWSSPLDVEGRSSFRGILGHSFTQEISTESVLRVQIQWYWTIYKDI